MRFGISSESASHTHTPGPTANDAMKIAKNAVTSQPFVALGSGPIFSAVTLKL